jgi:hypothetical protein
MSRLLDALLWLTVPSLAMSRRAEAQLDGRTQLRVSVVDSLTRVTLIAATLWMAATGNWGTALLFAGLLAALAVLRYLTAVWFTRFDEGTKTLAGVAWAQSMRGEREGCPLANHIYSGRSSAPAMRSLPVRRKT